MKPRNFPGRKRLRAIKARYRITGKLLQSDRDWLIQYQSDINIRLGSSRRSGAVGLLDILLGSIVVISPAGDE